MSMKKAIYRKFVLVILLALGLCTVIFYLIAGNILLDNTRKDLLYSLQMVDAMLDYDGDLKEQFSRMDALSQAQAAGLEKGLLSGDSRRLTILTTGGEVCVDTDVDDTAVMDNHLAREEIKDALEKGVGCSMRYSETLGTSMLYAAAMSSNGGYVIRLAIPFKGISEYIVVLLPALLLAVGVTLLISLIIADRFAKSVTKPLGEIAGEMDKIQQDAPDFHFEQYGYEELNVIAKTTEQMSRSVKSYIRKLEFEKQVRQEFFSNASHELKTPITSIKGYTELLGSGLITDETVKADFLRRITKETDNMTNLINDILMISRLETKEAEVTMNEVRMALVLEDAVKTFAPLAVENQVAVMTDCRPITVWASHQHMKELISNLLSNAIKYNKEGGTVHVRITAEDGDMLLEVRDSGVGIPEGSRQRVFERFYRVDKGRSKKVGGTGLGLSIVKHIVNFYNGTIEMESEVNIGTRFLIRIPIKKRDSDL